MKVRRASWQVRPFGSSRVLLKHELLGEEIATAVALPQPRLRLRSPPPRNDNSHELQLSTRDITFMLRQRAAEARAKLLELCRTDINAFCEYVLLDDQTGQTLEQSPFHTDVQAALTTHKQIVVMSHPDSGKALPLDTEIPTPCGWVTMGSLKVGDQVFGSDGKPCLVTFATGVQLGRRVFEVEFEDGVIIKADAEHQWSVRKRQSTQRVATTQEMAVRLRESDGHYVWAVPVTKPVQYQRCQLPIPAYVLGAWLGNGTSSNSVISFHEPDRFVWDQCVGYVGGHEPRRDRRNQVMYGTLGSRAGDIRGRLRELGVLDHKYIPELYLRASEEDRRALLEGLLDTDGSIGKFSRVELCFCNEMLANNALELIRSLGFRATIAESDAKIEGRVVGRRWRIMFTALEPVFRMPRKRQLQKLDSRSTRTHWKHVVAIREVASEPVRCIQVDNADRTYLVDRSYTVTHNTSQVAVGRVLWELGRNPNLRVMLLYNAEDSAMKTLATIRRYIESSKELRDVFPHMKKGETWKDDSIVVPRTAYSRDPSVVAVGYNSRRIQGSRVDLLIVDDLLDSQVTATESQRRKLSSWVKNTVLTRLTDRALVAFLTNAWHPRDLAHEMVNERGWHLIRRPIRNPDGKIWWWRWSEERLKLIRKSLGALEYARSYECDPRDDGSRVFRPEHIEHALKRGAGLGFLKSIMRMPDTSIMVTGVDVAAGDDTKKAGAKTVLTTVFFHANQTRQVVRIRSGRWRATQIISEVNQVGHVFPRNHWIVVETNNVQRWLLDLANENGMDIGVTLVPFLTGRNKMDPRFGVASMAAEFEGHRWILPSGCEREEEQLEVESLVAQAIDYVPEAHTGDHLMSLWFAREIGRRIFSRYFGDNGKKKEGSMVRAIG